MIKVVTFGVFDYYHYGHLCLFEQAKKYGDYLIVGIQDDKEITKRKTRRILYSVEKRVKMIENVKLVDEVFISTQVENDISKIDFDVLAVGEDQTHEGFKFAIDWCYAHNKSVVFLHRTPDISSTLIKDKVCFKT